MRVVASGGTELRPRMYECLNVLHSGECEKMRKKVEAINSISGGGNNSQSVEFLGRQRGSSAASSCRRRGSSGEEVSSLPPPKTTRRRCNNSSGSSGGGGSANEELVQPGCKMRAGVVTAEAEEASAGLNNLLGQLATKHKQKYRTKRRSRCLCPSGGVESSGKDEEESSVEVKQEDEVMWGGRLRRSAADAGWRRRSRTVTGVAAALAGSVVFRPAKLAWLVMVSLLLFSILVVPVAVVQGDEMKAGQVGPIRKGGRYRV